MNAHEDQGPRGQAMVEFALVIIVVLLFMIGLFDIGRVVFTANGLSNAVREGARQGSVSPLDCESIFHRIQAHTRGNPSVTAEVRVRRKSTTLTSSPYEVVCTGYDPGIPYDDDPATGSPGSFSETLIPGLYEVQVTADVAVALATPLVAQLAGEEFDIAADSQMLVTFTPSP